MTRPPKRRAHLLLGVVRELERLEHDVEPVVPDGARDQLVAVAGEVVLEPLDLQRVAGQGVEPALRHRERVVAEVDPAVVALLVHREVDDPGEGEAVRLGQLELAPDLRPRLGRDADEVVRRAGEEERRVPGAEPKLLPKRLGPLRPDVLGDGTGGLDRRR